MGNGISVMIVDDHAMFRSMLHGRLSMEPDITVVADVSSADEAIVQASIFNPDIVLMDVDMPGMVCFDAARAITARHPETRVIFLSAFFNDRYVEQALEVKAWGYVTKSEPEQSVVNAVREVHSGTTYFSPEVQSRLVVDTAGARLMHPTISRVSTLTNREMEMLRYIARGMSKKETAQTAHISVNTVNRHTSAVMNKLNLHNRVELARFAIREGLAEA